MTTETGIRTYGLLIDGQFVPAASGETFPTYNPATNEVIGYVARANREDVDRAVRAARRAFDEGPWGHMTPNERARRLRRVAEILRERVDELARLETLNCGKIIVESRMDILAAANCFDYYANLTGQIWGETIPMNGPLLDYTVREPYGVCGQIIPWNFPILMAAWKLAPALAAGNTVVLKPASYTPITALVLGQTCLEAGIPEGVVNVVTGPGSEVGAAICEHPLVDKIAFTGETETGREILRLSAGTIKKVSLELGGKSPNIVFPDADLEEAVNGSLFAIFTNVGQRCTARTRLLLHESIHDQFMDLFLHKASALRIGDPLDERTQLGPLVSRRQCERVLSYVERAKAEGAALRLGGKRPDGAPARELRRADDFRRGAAPDDDRPRGSLRSGARRHSVPHRGRGGRDRQCDDLRARCHDLDERHQAGASPGGADQGRQHQHQLSRRQSTGGPLRRLQAERYRAGTVAARARPLHAGQECRRGVE